MKPTKNMAFMYVLCVCCCVQLGSGAATVVYTDDPLVPADCVVAILNLDVGGVA